MEQYFIRAGGQISEASSLEHLFSPCTNQEMPHSVEIQTPEGEWISLQAFLAKGIRHLFAMLPDLKTDLAGWLYWFDDNGARRGPFDVDSLLNIAETEEGSEGKMVKSNLDNETLGLLVRLKVLGNWLFSQAKERHDRNSASEIKVESPVAVMPKRAKFDLLFRDSLSSPRVRRVVLRLFIVGLVVYGTAWILADRFLEERQTFVASLNQVHLAREQNKLQQIGAYSPKISDAEFATNEARLGLYAETMQEGIIAAHRNWDRCFPWYAAGFLLMLPLLSCVGFAYLGVATSFLWRQLTK